MKLVKTIIKGFNYPYFVSAFVRDKQLSDLKVSKQNGIKSELIIEACKLEFKKFSSKFAYSRQNVEFYFGVKFVNVRIEKSKVTRFEDTARLGSNTIFIYEKYVYFFLELSYN